MIINKIINLLITITSIIVIPLQAITTFVLGLIFSIPPLGLLLIPLSLIWVVLFLAPLLGLSYVYERVAILRPFIAIVGIPLVVIGNAYIAIIPSMGELESRFEKMIICQTFPYTWRYTQLQKGKDVIEKDDVLARILREISEAKPLGKYLDNLRADVVSRPYYMKKNYQLDW